MKTYKVRRMLSTYIVDAETRNKAKYAAYKVYKKKARKPKGFLKWVVGVGRVTVVKG